MPAKRYLLSCLAVIFLTGCAGLTPEPQKTTAVKRPSRPRIPQYEAPRPDEGSLWSEISEVSLYPDNKARKVGDIVVVKIEENPAASLGANTKTSRSSSISAKLKLFGYMKALAENNPRLAQTPGTDDLINAILASSFDGKGSSDRNGNIKAYISAVVVKVFPNGNMFVDGRREINVNNETQYITFSGTVRPEDISPNNEVSSTYIAGAKISYGGIGAITDKQRPGWLGRAIDYVWPF